MNFKTNVTDYSTQFTAIRAVREEVFIREQAIDPELEYDQYDNRCWHAVVYENDRPIGTGRLDVSQHGKIGRVAVLKSYRRRGVGTRVMEGLEAKARLEKLSELWFHSQLTAVAFYESLGYQVFGNEFLEAGIPHLEMKKKLAEQC